MKLFQQFVAAVLALTLFGCATQEGTTSNNPQYRYMGLLETAGEYKNADYQFSYSSPSSKYASSQWEHYEGQRGKRSTSLLIGQKGFNSYAVNVEYKGVVASQTTPLQAANQQYKSLDFVAFDGNASCVTTPLDHPVVISSAIVGLIAYCADKTRNALYEVSITWRSLTLPVEKFDQVIQESMACASDRLRFPQVKCTDTVGELVTAYNQLLNSFRFPGQKLASPPNPAQQRAVVKTYRSGDNAFAVQFPAMPLVTTGPTNNGTMLSDYRVGTPRYAFSIQVENRTLNTSSATSDSNTLAANIAATRAHYRGASGIEESPATKGRYKGRQLVGMIDGFRVRSTIFVTPSHVFTITTAGRPNDEVTESLCSAFVDSFEITD